MDKRSILGLVFLAAAVVCGSNNLVVKTRNGRVSGSLVFDTPTQNKYYAFRCIPYAKPPVGELRFQPPVPVDNWRGNGNSETCDMCPQIDFIAREYLGSEDCLKLNIYTPVSPDECDINEPLPVMVFITPGEWRVDTAERYDPALFMKTKKVILVTFNYRLGALGFLSTGDEIVPGNNGLKDQNMALRWIQENIRAFGGNPRKVTIFGSSAGGASVRYHMISPMSKGLFAGGIAHSSNELDTWTWQSSSDAVKLFNRFAQSLNCSSWDNEQTVSCLARLPAQELVNAEAFTFETPRIINHLTLFRPVTEVPNCHCFLCKNPVEILEAGEGNEVPLLMGLTENEGAYRYVEMWNLKKIDELFKNLHWLLPHSSASFRMSRNQQSEILDRVRDYYFHKGTKKDEDAKIDALIRLISDSWFLQGHNDLLKYLVRNYDTPVYQYVLSFNANLSFAQWQGHPRNFGASHYDEELYLFPSEIYFPGNVLSADVLAMIDRMVGMWTDFAIYQNPAPHSEEFNWDTVSAPGYDYLDIMGPNELVMKQNFHYDRAEFWRNLAYEYVKRGDRC